MLNLSAATGNQIQVMDLGFALQARSLRALAADSVGFAAGPQPVPAEFDDAVARGNARRAVYGLRPARCRRPSSSAPMRRPRSP